jgi:hypothetical protein
MLMITQSEGSELTRTLKLEGKLLGPWVGEMESACRTSWIPADRIRLDLHDLTFVDEAGFRFLERLIRDGARIIACSGYVAELLRHERP